MQCWHVSSDSYAKTPREGQSLLFSADLLIMRYLSVWRTFKNQIKTLQIGKCPYFTMELLIEWSHWPLTFRVSNIVFWLTLWNIYVTLFRVVWVCFCSCIWIHGMCDRFTQYRRSVLWTTWQYNQLGRLIPPSPQQTFWKATSLSCHVLS